MTALPKELETSRKRRLYPGTRVLAASVLLLLAQGCRKQQTGGAAVHKTVLRVGTWKTQQTIQPFFYSRFLPKNTVCEVSTFTNPGDQKTALLAGSLDFCGSTIVHSIVSASKRQPVVVVASLCNRCSALVVGVHSGIEKPADLAGRRIGYVPSTMHHILLLEVLAKAGLAPKDADLVRVDFFDMLTALGRGQIDAFLSGEPFPTLAVRKGVGRVLAYPYYPDTIGHINGTMLTSRKVIAEHPESIEALVVAHAKATIYLQQHKDEWIQRAAEFGYKPAVLRQAAKNIDLVWDVDADYIEHAKKLADRMKALGMIDRYPNWDSFFDTRFVKKARRVLGIAPTENAK